jgi:hypothetical protein
MVWGLWFRFLGFMVNGLGVWVQGLESRVLGVYDLGFGVWS